jgi:hypothetical protein
MSCHLQPKPRPPTPKLTPSGELRPVPGVSLATEQLDTKTEQSAGLDAKKLPEAPEPRSWLGTRPIAADLHHRRSAATTRLASPHQRRWALMMSRLVFFQVSTPGEPLTLLPRNHPWNHLFDKCPCQQLGTTSARRKTPRKLRSRARGAWRHWLASHRLLSFAQPRHVAPSRARTPLLLCSAETVFRSAQRLALSCVAPKERSD